MMTYQELNAMITESLNELEFLHRQETNYIENYFTGSNESYSFLNEIRRNMERCDKIIDECQRDMLLNKLSEINKAA
tara:strand:- start:900 stop:1130 length:231 start_codon:yes stop_codon:yes gene_type:complete